MCIFDSHSPSHQNKGAWWWRTVTVSVFTKLFIPLTRKSLKIKIFYWWETWPTKLRTKHISDCPYRGHPHWTGYLRKHQSQPKVLEFQIQTFMGLINECTDELSSFTHYNKMRCTHTLKYILHIYCSQTWSAQKKSEKKDTKKKLDTVNVPKSKSKVRRRYSFN